MVFLVLFIIALMFAIIGTVLAFVFILPANRRGALPGFFVFIHDTFNFKSLILEYILRALYVFSTLFVILYGFFMIFTFSSASLGGFLMMILGPIVIRIIFEGSMMFILLVKNTIEINNKLSNK